MISRSGVLSNERKVDCQENIGFITFSKIKKDFLSKPDKSGIGGIDKDIKNLVSLINKNKNYYTTSSCAGRIILMNDTGKKQENVFLFVTHKRISSEEITTSLKFNKRPTEIIYLKEEPCILHVACNSLEHASTIVNSARQCGWKKSGIIGIKPGKIMAELISTEILAAPMARKGKTLISKEYLYFLVSECNKKLKQTREKINKFEKAFKQIK